MPRRAVAGLCLTLFFAICGTAAAGGTPALELYFGKTVAPGDLVGIRGWSWFPEISSCELPVRLRIKDSGGSTRSMGSIQHRNDDFPTEVSGFRTIPISTRSGKATIIARQELKLRVFGLGCFAVGSRQVSLRNVTILGEAGNDPPRLTGAAADPAWHGGTAAIHWNQSETATATVQLSFLFNSKHAIDVGTLFSGERPAGANALPFDGTFEGAPLPLGRYRVRIQAEDASGAFSDFVRAEFNLGTG
jgi:hypothetical protein